MSKIVQAVGTIDRKARKEDISELAKEHANQIIAEGYDLLKVYVELKRYEVYLSTIISELKDATLEKAKEKGQKKFDYANARVTIGNRTKYHYEVDERWCMLNAELEKIKKEKKARENLLKQIEGESMEIVDKETGEVERVTAPLKEIINHIMIKL